jgi:hypothetical protein
MHGNDSPHEFVRSYLFLRKAIGLIGMALPPVLIIGVTLTTGGVLSSISAYYYSDLRNVLVGCLCAVGVFLILYRGPQPRDDVFTSIAGYAAVGVALCPTRPPSDFTSFQEAVGVAHIVCAGTFFLTLSYICCFLFIAREKEPPRGLDRKFARNIVYVTCGITIAACVVLMVVLGALLEAETRSLRPALWLESIAIFAFGTAWLIKGNTLLKDKPTINRTEPASDTVAV